ncbi:MAG: glycosyltransferase [Acetobacteraceae bacterium]|nr:glycosyltransferase [Acetobacteraceae bacterium]
MILLLSSAHRPDDRRVAALEAASLAEAGFDLLHVCVAGEASPAGVPTVALRRGPGVVQRLMFLVRIGLVAARHRPRLVQANEPDSWAVALALKAFLRCRVLFDAHEDYLDPDRLGAVARPLRPLAARALAGLFRAFARHSDGILCVSAERVAVFPLPRRAPPVLIVRNTVRRAETLALPRAEAATLARFDSVAVGAMGWQRGWPAMVAALAATPLAPFRCVIVGPVTDGSEPSLRAEIERRGLTDRILLVGRLPRALALERAARGQIALVLFAARARNHETALPHKLFEAMALGLPVAVSSAVRPAAALVRDIGCGVAVDAERDAALADALGSLYFRPLDRLVMGELGRRASLGRLAWEEDAAGLVGFHGRLLGTARSGLKGNGDGG